MDIDYIPLKMNREDVNYKGKLMNSKRASVTELNLGEIDESWYKFSSRIKLGRGK